MATAVRKLKASGNTALAVLVLLALTIIVGCGGDAGVDDGNIVGRVFADVAGDVPTTAQVPLAGVSVLAQREDDPTVIRTTVTDANGGYVLNGMPVAKYVIGFAKRGFRTIDTRSGATQNRTALGDQVRVFVEPSKLAIAADVTMTRLAESGAGNLIVTVTDAVTGAPILDATVSAGVVATSESDPNGRYTLIVPVIVFDPNARFGTPPASVNLLVTAPGFTDDRTRNVTPLSNVTINQGVELTPLTSQLKGIVKISQFEELFSKTTIKIESQNTKFNNSARVNDDGSFSLDVPSSTPSVTRQFNLLFTHPGLQNFTLNNVVAPRNGARNLAQTVEMKPKLITLVGSVVTSEGLTPNGDGPVADTVTIQQTGQQAVIISGTYTIPGVPTGADRARQLTLDVKVFRKQAGKIVQETGNASVTPLTDTIFQVPLIRTAGGGN